MTHLMDKDALVAEIERRINELNPDNIEDWRYRLQREHDIELLKSILSLINTLEVKEVDLEVELANYNREYVDENGFFNTEHFAKYFFELGLKAAQKGEDD